MDRNKLIGLRIRTMRQSRKMTQADLAYAINQSASSITIYETGRRCPDFETLEALADVFNVPLASIVSDDDSSPELDPQIHAVSTMMEGMSKDQKDQILAIVRAYASTQRKD